MATRKQKQELIDVLKFTPCTYKIEMTGYGGEVYAGRVPVKAYRYFQEHEIDINEWAHDWDNEAGVPEEFHPFPPGSAYDCEDIAHENGVEMSSACQITVSDEHGNDVWASSLDPEDLDMNGVEALEDADICVEDRLKDGEVAMLGQNGEKGLFFSSEVLLKQPFDHRLLSISYTTVEGWRICRSISYAGEELESWDYGTTGKSSEHQFIVKGDIDQTQDSWDPTQDLDDILEEFLPSQGRSAWFPVDTRPLRTGLYECQFEGDLWPWPRMCEWTGRTWTEDGKRVSGIVQWRGLDHDPKSK